MLKDLKIYQHEFLANVYLNPPTMDMNIEASPRIHRLDFLFVKDAIKLGEIKPIGYVPVEAICAILTEPNTQTCVLKQPYKAQIRQADELKELKTRDETTAVVKALSMVRAENSSHPDKIYNLADYIHFVHDYQV